MSAPDIGALAKRLDDVETLALSVKRELHAALGATVRAEFGAVKWTVSNGWLFAAGDVYVDLDFEHWGGGKVQWHSAAIGRGRNRPILATARADTPTAAVRQALAALAKTHPTEAAALRAAVTFKEPTP